MDRLNYTPVSGLLDKTVFPTYPQDETAARNQFQTLFNQVKDFINNTLTVLEGNVSGRNGAGEVGSLPISGVSGDTVYEQLCDLKSQLNGITLGSVPDLSITTQKIAEGAVTADKLDPNAITATLQDGSVTTQKIADSAVITEKIAAGAVNADKIENNSITAAKLQPSAVTAYAVANTNGAASNISISSGTATNMQLNDGALKFAPSALYKGTLTVNSNGTLIFSRSGDSNVYYVTLSIFGTSSTPPSAGSVIPYTEYKQYI